VPDIANASYDMAPVDYVSAVIARRVLADDGAGGTWHFLNPARLSTGALVDGLRAAGHPVRLAGYAEWRAALQQAVAGGEENAWPASPPCSPSRPTREPGFDCGATERMAAALGQVCPPADGALFATYLVYMRGQGYSPLPAPHHRKGHAHEHVHPLRGLARLSADLVRPDDLGHRLAPVQLCAGHLGLAHDGVDHPVRADLRRHGRRC
jgi:hypothetical protein